MSSLLEQPLLFVDCQTTGATPNSAHLLEVGWTIGRAADKKPPVIITRLVALPDDQILPARIQKITGISQEDMAAATALPLIVQELQETLSQNSLTFLCAHWAQFEKNFLSDCFTKHSAVSTVEWQFICTCQIAKKLYPALPSRAIRAVSGYFGLSVEEMKRSHGHVEATYFIWQKIAPDLDRAGIKTMTDLVEWLKPAPKATGKKIKNETSYPAKDAFLLRLERLTRLELPNQPGVYRMLNANGKILYVGKATSLKSRVNSYFTGRKGKDSKTKELISQVFDLNVSPLATPLEAALLENDLIKEHDPPYNRALKKRGRSLIYFDRRFTSASIIPDKMHVLGPFPRGSTIEPLILLSQGIKEGSFAPGLFWGLLDEEATNRAVSLFFDFYKCDIDLDLVADRHDGLFVRSLLALGMSFYRRDLLDLLKEQEELQKKDSKKSSSSSSRPKISGISLSYFLGPRSNDADEEEIIAEEVKTQALLEGSEVATDDGNDALSDELTDEELIQMVRSLITGAARAYCRASTLMRLLNATVLYEEKNRRRKLVFERGFLVRSEDFSPATDFASGGESFFRPAVRNKLPVFLDLATYDRMCVLLAEIRRLYGRGHWVSLTEAELVIS